MIAVLVSGSALMALTIAAIAGTVLTGADSATGGVSSSPAPVELVALTGDQMVVLDSRTGAERRVLADHPPGGDGTLTTLQGIALTPDGRHVYYSVVGADGQGTIHRVATDGRHSPEIVGSGISPAVSPDGRYLAFAAPGPTGPDGSAQCCNAIAVRGIAPKALRMWRHPEADTASGGWLHHASFTKLAWAPDSRQLAFTVSYEGDTVAVLDTATHRDLAESIEVVIPGGGGDSRHPTWQATSGRLAVVNRAFDCCFEDDYVGPTRTVLTDVPERRADDLLDPGVAPTWLDFDATGDHLLSVEDGRLYRRSHGGAAVELAPGVRAADW